MSDDLDKQLRAALRSVDPDEEFARGVLSRVARDAGARRSHAPWRWRWAAALAVVTLSTVGLHQWQVNRARGFEARRQLIEALQVTGQKLDLAYRAVNPSAGANTVPGA